MFVFLFSTLAAKKAIDASTQDSELSFEEFLDNKTPLDMSIASLRSYFRGVTFSTASLKTRDIESSKKTTNTYFNEAFSSYIKDIYNRQGYGKALSQDGSHIIEFLKLNNELNLDRTTVYVILRLFHNKMKSAECELIDDTVAQQLLKEMPSLLENQFKEQEEKKLESVTFIQSHTEELMLNAFINHLPKFQQQPDTFISGIAENIGDLVKQEITQIKIKHQKEIVELESQIRLRSTIIRMFENILGKLVWNIKSYEGIWVSFITIANRLQLLGAHDIIDHMDDLDDLLWSLTHRFCWFLDFAGHALPLEFYEEIETDLVNKVVYFLEVPEQDPGIKNKKDTLIEALINAKTKAIAQLQGIVHSY